MSLCFIAVSSFVRRPLSHKFGSSITIDNKYLPWRPTAGMAMGSYLSGSVAGGNSIHPHLRSDFLVQGLRLVGVMPRWADCTLFVFFAVQDWSCTLHRTSIQQVQPIANASSAVYSTRPSEIETRYRSKQPLFKRTRPRKVPGCEAAKRRCPKWTTKTYHHIDWPCNKIPLLPRNDGRECISMPNSASRHARDVEAYEAQWK